MKTKWSKQIYTTLNTELHDKRHIHAVGSTLKPWVWIQRHT